MNKDGGPAFPTPIDYTDENGKTFSVLSYGAGITVRQLYKCFSLRTWRSASMGREGCDEIAKRIGEMADALLKEDEEHER